MRLASAAGIRVLLVLSFGVFLMVALSGDPLAQLRANPQISPATIAAASAQLHLNEPLVAALLELADRAAAARPAWAPATPASRSAPRSCSG